METNGRIPCKYRDITRELRTKITKDEYHTKLPGLRELAKEYGVNFKTIKKALIPLVDEGLVSLSPGRGTSVSRTHLCIGIAGNVDESFFHGGSGYYPPIFQVIQSVIEERGDFFSFQVKNPKIPYGKLFKNNLAIDGLIIFAPCNKDMQALIQMRESGLPFLVIGSSFSGMGISYVDTDNCGDTAKGISYLIEKGHKRIFFLSPAFVSPTMKLRLDGYKRALAEHGLPYDESLVFIDEENPADFEKHLSGIFESPSGPTALFGAQSTVTEKALKMLGKDRRAKIDVMVYDDYHGAFDAFSIPYSTVLQPLHKIGQAAAETLYALIEGKTASPVQVLFSSSIAHKKGGAL